MTDEIDAIMSEAFPAAAQTQPETPDTNPADAPVETPEAENQEVEAAEPEEATGETKDKPEEMFPKKAVNALSRRDKQIGKLRAEKQQMQQELETLRQKANPDKPEVKSAAPSEQEFEKQGKTYGEFLTATARYEAKQEFTQAQAKLDQDRAKAELAEWQEERGEALKETSAQARKALSDFDKVLSAAKPILDQLPSKYSDLFLESDNAPYAAYAMQKEGILDDLASMSLTQAARVIVEMEAKGLALTKKQTTNAPAPLISSKGNAAGTSKSLDKLSPSETVEWLLS